jgi:hypothetical protein
MGYRSDVTILMYGEPQDCDVVLNLFAASDVEQGLKDFFETHKRERVDEHGTKWVLWEFPNFKWYDECQHAKAKLFEFITAFEDERGGDGNVDRIAAEFVRIGEEDADIEYDGTEYHDWQLHVSRTIEYPNVFNSKGE